MGPSEHVDPSEGDLEAREHERLERIPLDPAELAVLTGLTPPAVDVRPSPVRGTYDLAFANWVGTIALGRRTVRILPKVPMANLLFLLTYDGDREVRGAGAATHETSDDVLEAIAARFVRHAALALRQGILEDYRPIEESSRVVRGRIAFDRQVRLRPGMMIPIEVDRDVRDEDTLINRLLRAAVTTLERLPLRSRGLRDDLHRLDVLLRGVSLQRFDPAAVPEVTFAPHTAHFRVPVRLATLILRSTSLTHRAGPVPSHTFLVDMNAAFEAFVRAAVAETIPTALGTIVAPGARPVHHLDVAGHVRIEPDLRLLRGDAVVAVGDVKYKRVTAGRRLASPDLYQATAYAIALGLRDAFLIHPTSEAEDRTLRIVGTQLDVHLRGLDLSRAPGGILDDVRAIGEEMLAAAERPASWVVGPGAVAPGEVVPGRRHAVVA